MGTLFESYREKMLFLALIAMASAVQYNVMYTYSGATCTTANANGIFAVPVGAACTTNTNCSNTGYKVEYNVNAATVPTKATCGLNTFASASDCSANSGAGQNPTRVVRFTPGECHNINGDFLATSGVPAGCPAAAKSVRAGICFGSGAAPGLSTFTCYQKTDCADPYTTTPFTTVATTTNASTTTPSPLMCKTCENPGLLPVVSYSFCGSSFMQVSVAVVAMVAVLVAAF